ncbi:MAG: hypothetical protein QOH72_4084 [Solirubrobacteraceae bacterium]|jgi:hypothetical protein|nr:hypothetical protein [Solirubrobacteraceae bacterium]
MGRVVRTHYLSDVVASGRELVAQAVAAAEVGGGRDRSNRSHAGAVTLRLRDRAVRTSWRRDRRSLGTARLLGPRRDGVAGALRTGPCGSRLTPQSSLLRLAAACRAAKPAATTPAIGPRRRRRGPMATKQPQTATFAAGPTATRIRLFAGRLRLRPRSPARLKIVVPPVRVRVSPSGKVLEKGALSVLRRSESTSGRPLEARSSALSSLFMVRSGVTPGPLARLSARSARRLRRPTSE